VRSPGKIDAEINLFNSKKGIQFEVISDSYKYKELLQEIIDTGVMEVDSKERIKIKKFKKAKWLINHLQKHFELKIRKIK